MCAVEFKINRWKRNATGTLGNFYVYIDGQLVLKCYSLEPPLRERFSFIPDGTYKVMRSLSRKFKQKMLYVFVPGRQGIMIHPGNSASDTRGCILLGTQFMSTDSISLKDSRSAFLAFNDVLDLLSDESLCNARLIVKTKISGHEM